MSKNELQYYVLDVFAKQKYEGNPLSVVVVEKDLELPVYQKIAREFGYSETSFIKFSEADNLLKVRSFTPAGFEVGGAGHNLLGAICLALYKNWNIFGGQSGEKFVIMQDQRRFRFQLMILMMIFLLSECFRVRQRSSKKFRLK